MQALHHKLQVFSLDQICLKHQTRELVSCFGQICGRPSVLNVVGPQSFRRVGAATAAFSKKHDTTSPSFGPTHTCEGVAGLHQGRERLKRRTSAIRALLAEYEDTEKSVSLPINYYQVLGAEEGALDEESIVRAYEVRAANPPLDGYSPETLAARTDVLRAARATLSDPELRAEHDEDLRELQAQGGGSPVVSVPAARVAGVLCVLQEAGDAQTVAEAGDALLGGSALRGRHVAHVRRDVALATALAYDDLSKDAMSASPPAVARGCLLLEHALKTLQEEGRKWGGPLAPALQEVIDETLAELAPLCVLDLLNRPLTEDNAATRKEALQALRQLLWSEEEEGGGAAQERLMHQAFALMTAAEQVEHYLATPDSVDAGAAEVYAIALAYVARGFASHYPTDIEEAGKLLSELQRRPGQDQQQQGRAGEAAAPPGAAGEDDAAPAREVALERAMCSLLLGDVEACKKWLGLHVDPPLGDLAVAQFVYMHSPRARSCLAQEWGLLPHENNPYLSPTPTSSYEQQVAPAGATAAPAAAAAASSGGKGKRGEDEEEGDPLLPGLCMLTECWLEEAVLARFRWKEGEGEGEGEIGGESFLQAGGGNGSRGRDRGRGNSGPVARPRALLTDYFDDPDVTRRLERSSQGAMGAPLRALLARSPLGGVRSITIDALRALFPRPPAASSAAGAGAEGPGLGQGQGQGEEASGVESEGEGEGEGEGAGEGGGIERAVWGGRNSAAATAVARSHRELIERAPPSAGAGAGAAGGSAGAAGSPMAEPSPLAQASSSAAASEFGVNEGRPSGGGGEGGSGVLAKVAAAVVVAGALALMAVMTRQGGGAFGRRIRGGLPPRTPAYEQHLGRQVSSPSAAPATPDASGAGAAGAGAASATLEEEEGQVRPVRAPREREQGQEERGIKGKGEEEEEEKEDFLEVQDVAWAEAVLHRWQQVKASACGPSHAIHQLETVLEGPMLALWRARAEEVQANSWYWDYTFVALKIERVTVSRSGRAAVVEATVQEAARIFSRQHPEHNNSYRGTYDVRYELVASSSPGEGDGGLGEAGGASWKVYDSTILR